MTQLYTALVKVLLQRYMESHPEGPTLDITTCPSSLLPSQRVVDIFDDFPSSIYHQICIISKLAYEGLSNNQQLIFFDLPENFETLGLLEEVPQFYPTGKGFVSYNFLHLTVQEYLAAFHIMHQGTRKQEKFLRGEVVFSSPVMSRYEEKEIGRGYVRMFVAGLSGLRQSKLLLSKRCSLKDITLLHLLFESQNETLTTSMLGNEDIIRTVLQQRLSPHDAYVLGFCISLSRCQWDLQLLSISDEHIDMMKGAIANWGCGQGRIISVSLKGGTITSDGIGNLLSLPHNTLSSLHELNLWYQLDSKSCDILAQCLSSLTHLKALGLINCKIGSEDAQLLSQPLRANTSLRKLSLYSNVIMDRGTCSLAQALNENKCLQKLVLSYNQIGSEGAGLLTQSLHINTTLRELDLSGNNIGDRGACTLAEALTLNECLEKLDLSRN